MAATIVRTVMDPVVEVEEDAAVKLVEVEEEPEGVNRTERHQMPCNKRRQERLFYPSSKCCKHHCHAMSMKNEPLKNKLVLLWQLWQFAGKITKNINSLPTLSY